MDINELLARLEKAQATLGVMKTAAEKDLFGIHEEARLAGKLEGVSLAISYVREFKKFNDGN
jgi:hypothetical protein